MFFISLKLQKKKKKKLEFFNGNTPADKIRK